MTNNDLFKIDELSNFGDSEEFKNIGTLTGGAKKKKSFSLGNNSKNKANNNNLKNKDNDSDSKNKANNNSNNSLNKGNETSVSKNNVGNNSLNKDEDNDDEKDNDTKSVSIDMNNENTGNSLDMDDDDKSMNDDEPYTDENKDDNEKMDNLLTDIGNSEEELPEDVEEDNNLNLSKLMKNSENTNVDNAGSLLNLVELRHKFYELLFSMRDDTLDFNEDENEDLRPLLYLLDDNKYKLSVLAKMREDGLITL